ncbi:acyl carrier protein [Streptomyces sp. HPF1205]|uniref:acyl carrier protein n=1 Tax=Streptomyces sp. HPF1205 TaxID=2873262 RepID=UPI001CED6CF5|nr:acyl carrier protein [Streptomyces sp. HPF1205]
MRPVPDRAEIVAILADFGGRPPEQVPEGIDSMELAWLVHRIEQRYGGRVDDEAMERMTTVTGVLEVLAELPAQPDVSGPRAPGSGVPAPPSGADGGPHDHA